MPIYEFKCGSCGSVFEKLMPASTSEVPACSKCGGNDVKKLFSSFGFASGGKKNLGGGCNTCSSSSCSTCGK